MNKSELIKKIIEEYSFKNQKEKNPESCPCYTEGVCHKLPEKELICLLCLCPEYQVELRHEDGTCKIKSPLGKWFHHSSHPNRKIWDCSDCSIPHTKNYVERYLERLSEGEFGKLVK